MLLSSYRIPFLIPYFVEMQRKSFLNFLNTGLNYEITKKNPMYVCFKQFKITFYPEAYKLSVPEYTSKTAILKFQTYSSKLYIPVEFTNFSTKELKLQWVLLGTLPLMTKRGHFIVNGCPRVIVNQIVRSPGIYYKIIYDEKKRKSYYGDLISQRGAWLRLEIDKKKRVWVKIKKSRKIPILIFFKALGISDVKLEQSTKYTDFLEISKQETESIESTDYFHPSSVEDCLIWIYGFVYPEKKEKGQVSLKKAKKFLEQKFFNHGTYDLGNSGRNQLNRKFNLKVSENVLVLTPHDLLCAMDYLIKLEQGIGITDDIDDLKNRRVRTCGELLQNQVGTGFIRLEKFIKNKTENPTFNVSKMFSSKPVDGALREFFGSSPLSQFMDQTNPLAELTHKRRISSLGPGGVSRETAGMQVRGIHASHYGRICPIETPEGRNAGLVNSLTTLARINKQGFIETPFYNVYQGQIQKFGSTALLSATHESQISIAASDLQTNYFYFLPYRNIPARAYGEFQTLARHKIQYMSVSPIQMISIATSLIPFLEHDDANRALMGSNMQRQAVPLILPERPVVGTGLETRIVSDSGHGLQANMSGIVIYTSSKNICVKSFSSFRSCLSDKSPRKPVLDSYYTYRSVPFISNKKLTQKIWSETELQKVIQPSSSLSKTALKFFEPKYSFMQSIKRDNKRFPQQGSKAVYQPFSSTFAFTFLRRFAAGSKSGGPLFLSSAFNTKQKAKTKVRPQSEKQISDIKFYLLHKAKRIPKSLNKQNTNSLLQQQQSLYSDSANLSKFCISQKNKLNIFNITYQITKKAQQSLTNAKNFRLLQIASSKFVVKQEKNKKNVWVGFIKSKQVKNSIAKNILHMFDFNKNPTNLENINSTFCIKTESVDYQINSCLLQSKYTLNFFTQNNIFLQKRILKQNNQFTHKFYASYKIRSKKQFILRANSKIKIGLLSSSFFPLLLSSACFLFCFCQKQGIKTTVDRNKTRKMRYIRQKQKYKMVITTFDYFFLGFNCINFTNISYNLYQNRILNSNSRNYEFQSETANLSYSKNLKNFVVSEASLAFMQSIKPIKTTWSSGLVLNSRPVQFREIYLAKAHFIGLPLKPKIKINTLQLIAIQTNLNLQTNKVYFINCIPHIKNICDILQIFDISNKLIPKKPNELRRNSDKFYWLWKKQNFFPTKQSVGRTLQTTSYKMLQNPKQFQWGPNFKLRCIKKKLEFNQRKFSSKVTYIHKEKLSSNFLENTSDFIKGFLKECMELVFIQIFVKKKSLKHIFFFTSINWENFQNQRSLPVRFFKKTRSSNFFKVSRFTRSLIKKNSILGKKTVYKKYYTKHILKMYSLPYNQHIRNMVFFNKKLESAFIFQAKIKKFKVFFSKYQKTLAQTKQKTKLFFIKQIQTRENEIENKSFFYQADSLFETSGPFGVRLYRAKELFGTRVRTSNNNQTEKKITAPLTKKNKVSTLKFFLRYITFETIQRPYYLKDLYIRSSYFSKKNSFYNNRDRYHSICHNVLPNLKIKQKSFFKNSPRLFVPKSGGSVSNPWVYKLKKNYISLFPFSNKLGLLSLAGVQQRIYKSLDYKNFSTCFHLELPKTITRSSQHLEQAVPFLFLKKQTPLKTKTFPTKLRTKHFSMPLFQTEVGSSSVSSMKYKLAKKSQTPLLFTSVKNLKDFKHKFGGSLNFTHALLTRAEKKENIRKIHLRQINSYGEKIQKEITVNQSLKNKVNNCFCTSKFLQSSLKFFSSWNKSSPTVKIQNYTLGPYQHSNQNTCLHQVPLVSDGEWIQKGDLLTDGSASVAGELALGKSILVAYMPWEGYNFEDAILVSERLIYDDLYTSIHIEKYTTEISDTQYGREQITASINVSVKQLFNLDKDGIIKFGTWVNQGDILVGKLTPIRERKLSGHEKLLSDVLGMKKNVSIVKDTSLRVPKYISGRVVHIERLENENISSNSVSSTPSRVHIYIAEKKKVQVGDKMSGRHGNKGIISKILPRQDMPYLADGTPIDMVLNPLGVPSRMNVGQIFECLLGLAAKELNQQFKISCFDEMNGAEASRSFTYSKLFEARLKTGKRWLFHPDSPGKMKLFDGRTGECFHQHVTVGKPYMLKLIHLVDEKIHARSTGPYSLVTQQPVRGRSKQGGQRLGEMEVWALEGFGAAYTLQELLTMKSDDIEARHQVIQAILERKSIAIGTPESFKVLLLELQSLCLHIGVYSISNTGNRQRINSDYLF